LAGAFPQLRQGDCGDAFPMRERRTPRLRSELLVVLTVPGVRVPAVTPATGGDVRDQFPPSLYIYDTAGDRGMRNLRIDWPVFAESVLGSMILVMVFSLPLLAGQPIGQWALAAALGLVIGLIIYVRVRMLQRSRKDSSENSDDNLE
jgi:hypothetical protein